MSVDVSKQAIEKFLEGRNKQKYIVNIEANYYSNVVDLVINDPIRGKYIEQDTYRPFLWMKYDIGDFLYGGDRKLTRRKLTEANIDIELLRIKADDGSVPERLQNGYKYLITGNGSYTQLLKFFEDGGVDIFGDHKQYFMTLSPVEQYMIQTGKRLFKGMEDYNDLLRLQFDIETTGLDPKKDRTFLIGVKTNRGYEHVIRINKDERNSEINGIKEFFEIVDEIKPDIIAGYNSENFDFDFMTQRASKLGYEIQDLSKTLNDKRKIYFKKGASLKLGGETEYYTQTNMWGYTVIDIAHAVRRAQAINSSIKSWGLKYITKYAEKNKPNRVYVPGDVIYKLWADKENDYALNDENGDWYKLTDEKPLKESYKICTGAYLVERYLQDDLWETEKIDYEFNQASFLLAKILPTLYSKSSTMGTASIWKLIMCAWSYEKKLGVPSLETKRDFVGGLSRLLEVGFAENVAKADYAALYPNTEITHEIKPDLDITNAMLSMLLYIAETRDEYKNLKNEYKEKAVAEQDPIKKAEYESLANLYDRKQLPLKILANSFFGSFGAPYIFPWGDTDCAEETTCRGRQYLRLMVKFFTERGLKALVLDTDGVNFALPKDIDKFVYISDGTHRFNVADKEYHGLEALVAEFNDLYMEGRMGLDIDEVAQATINFARKNYADLLIDKKGKTKIKLVGNTIKSKKMPGYIEDFLDSAVALLLNGKGYEFVNLYYEYVNKIYTFQIPLAKIASKGRVKLSIDAYKLKCLKTNKNGKPLPKQAHMELLIKEGINPDLGHTVYYVNTGDSKSSGDIQTVEKNKMNKKEREAYFLEHGSYPKVIKELVLNCKLIPNELIENDPELTTDEYNVPKYLAAFNKRIKPLLVCFHPDIREKIMIDMVKDKKTKKLILQTRNYFTEKECVLCARMPYKETDQDTYEDLMKMTDKEIYFWAKVESKGKYPNHISKDDWEALKIDYIQRMRVRREQEREWEESTLMNKIRRLEVKDIQNIIDTGELPKDIKDIIRLKVINDEVYVYSKILISDYVIGLDDIKYGELSIFFKFKKEAEERDKWYKTLNIDNLDLEDKTLFDLWVDYLREEIIIKEKPELIIEPEDLLDDDDDENIDDEDAYIETPEPELPKSVIKENIKKTLSIKIVNESEEDDEWNF